MFTGLIVSTGCTVTTSTDDTADVTVDNEETFTIDNIYLDGFDILDGVPLDQGETVTELDVDCGSHTLEIVDESSTYNDCYLDDFDPCSDGDYIYVDDAFFDDCTTGRQAPSGAIQASQAAVAQARK